MNNKIKKISKDFFEEIKFESECASVDSDNFTLKSVKSVDNNLMLILLIFNDGKSSKNGHIVLRESVDGRSIKKNSVDFKATNFNGKQVFVQEKDLYNLCSDLFN